MKIDADLVRKMRAVRNWSQEQLSEASGLSVRTIQRLEASGKASIESVRVLAEVFAVSPEKLLVPEPAPSGSPVAAWKAGLAGFADFSGRATRYEYWWFFLLVLLLAGVAGIIDQRLLLIVSVVVALPLLAAGSRRLNDAGYSAWWQLMWLVPFGVVVVFLLQAQKSGAGPVRGG